MQYGACFAVGSDHFSWGRFKPLVTPAVVGESTCRDAQSWKKWLILTQPQKLDKKWCKKCINCDKLESHKNYQNPVLNLRWFIYIRLKNNYTFFSFHCNLSQDNIWKTNCSRHRLNASGKILRKIQYNTKFD